MSVLRKVLALGGIAAVAYALAITPLHLAAHRKEPAPSFVLADLAGHPVALESFRGRPVLLNFWATWCGPCRAELPALQVVSRDSSDCLAVLGVAINSGSPEEIARFVRERGVDYPILLGDQKVVADYGVSAVPLSVLLDADGREAARWEGAISLEWVLAAVHSVAYPLRC